MMEIETCVENPIINKLKECICLQGLFLDNIDFLENTSCNKALHIMEQQ